MEARATVTEYGSTADNAITNLETELASLRWRHWRTIGNIDIDTNGPCLALIWRSRVDVIRTIGDTAGQLFNDRGEPIETPSLL